MSSSNWPIDGKISKAMRKGDVYPEKKYIDSYFETKDDHPSSERNRSPDNRKRESSPIENKRKDQASSNERNLKNSPQSNKNDNDSKNKNGKNSQKEKNSKISKTYNCCSKCCGNFVRMPLW